jgi:hypothetical protein
MIDNKEGENGGIIVIISRTIRCSSYIINIIYCIINDVNELSKYVMSQSQLGLGCFV